MVRPDPPADDSGMSPPQPRPSSTGDTAGTGGHPPASDRGRKRALPLNRPRHPASLEVERQRFNDVQLRLADRITAFAGSMNFVYLHIVVFASWMLLVEKSPWPTLTLIVSLEAIFLSTFVMIGQNRQSEFQQAKADHDFTEQELELKTNTQLTREIHLLTEELHKRFLGDPTQQS